MTQPQQPFINGKPNPQYQGIAPYSFEALA